MKYNFNKMFGLLFLALSLWGCQSSDEEPELVLKERKDIVLSRSEEVILDKSFDFAFQLFQQVNNAETDNPNWMISPLSMSYALGMMANGASGNTLDEIKTVLGHKDVSMEELNAYYKMLTASLLDLDNSTQIGIANSLWTRAGFPVKESYVSTVEDVYDAQVNELSDSPETAMKDINRWCAEKTNSLIPQIYKEPISNDIKMMFINALSFKGKWKDPFKKSRTIKDDFLNADESVSKVDMMQHQDAYRYFGDNSWEVLELPYGNEAFSMVIMMPAEGLSLNEEICKLTGDDWKMWNEKLYEYRQQFFDLKFPRFEMNYQKDMIDILVGMGIKDVFKGNADFSKLTSNSVSVQLLNQHTYIKVDEEGTTAAAVTDGEIRDTSSPSPDFFVNRPFLYFIKEKSTNAILFMGKITKL